MKNSEEILKKIELWLAQKIYQNNEVYHDQGDIGFDHEEHIKCICERNLLRELIYIIDSGKE